MMMMFEVALTKACKFLNTFKKSFRHNLKI